MMRSIWQQIKALYAKIDGDIDPFFPVDKRPDDQKCGNCGNCEILLDKPNWTDGWTKPRKCHHDNSVFNVEYASHLNRRWCEHWKSANNPDQTCHTCWITKYCGHSPIVDCPKWQARKIPDDATCDNCAQLHSMFPCRSCREWKDILGGPKMWVSMDALEYPPAKPGTCAMCKFASLFTCKPRPLSGDCGNWYERDMCQGHCFREGKKPMQYEPTDEYGRRANLAIQTTWVHPPLHRDESCTHFEEAKGATECPSN